VHLKVYVSGVINTSVQLLWDLVRDYGQAHTWFGTYRGVKTFTSLLVSLRIKRTGAAAARLGVKCGNAAVW